MSKKEKFNLEKSLANLEEIVNKLDSSDLTLENSLELFETGINLAKLCESNLKATEQKVEILTKSLTGKLETKPFNEEDQ